MTPYKENRLIFLGVQRSAKKLAATFGKKENKIISAAKEKAETEETTAPNVPKDIITEQEVTEKALSAKTDIEESFLSSKSKKAMLKALNNLLKRQKEDLEKQATGTKDELIPLFKKTQKQLDEYVQQPEVKDVFEPLDKLVQKKEAYLKITNLEQYGLAEEGKEDGYWKKIGDELTSHGITQDDIKKTQSILGLKDDGKIGPKTISRTWEMLTGQKKTVKNVIRKKGETIKGEDKDVDELLSKLNGNEDLRRNLRLPKNEKKIAAAEKAALDAVAKAEAAQKQLMPGAKAVVPVKPESPSPKTASQPKPSTKPETAPQPAKSQAPPRKVNEDPAAQIVGLSEDIQLAQEGSLPEVGDTPEEPEVAEVAEIAVQKEQMPKVEEVASMAQAELAPESPTEITPENIDTIAATEEGRAEIREIALDENGEFKIPREDPLHSTIKLTHLHRGVKVWLNDKETVFQKGKAGETYYYASDTKLKNRVRIKNGDQISALPPENTLQKEAISTRQPIGEAENKKLKESFRYELVKLAEKVPVGGLSIVVANGMSYLTKRTSNGFKFIEKSVNSIAAKGYSEKKDSYQTPRGLHKIKATIRGELGSVIERKKVTAGKVRTVKNGAGDKITTVVLTLEGLEGRNSNSAARGIYIHGTEQENKLGQQASHGCVRMANLDVQNLHDRVVEEKIAGRDIYVYITEKKAETPPTYRQMLTRHRGEDSPTRVAEGSGEAPKGGSFGAFGAVANFAKANLPAAEGPKKATKENEAEKTNVLDEKGRVRTKFTEAELSKICTHKYTEELPNNVYAFKALRQKKKTKVSNFSPSERAMVDVDLVEAGVASESSVINNMKNLPKSHPSHIDSRTFKMPRPKKGDIVGVLGYGGLKYKIYDGTWEKDRMKGFKPVQVTK
jgi:hypothetical protein